MATWPASLPQVPLQRGFSEEPQDQVLRTEMDAGPAQTRRRFTAAYRVFSIRLKMSSTQFDTFLTFLNDTIGGGALQFDWAAPDIMGGTGSFKFVGTYSVSPPSGDYVIVSAKVERLP